jgi:hypothetical protein
MKNFKKHTLNALVTLILVLMAFWGCSVEQLIEGKEVVAIREVVFHINVSGRSDPATRSSLSAKEENEVKTIEMLLFDKSTNKLAHSPVFANEISPVGGSEGRKKSFRVSLPEGAFEAMIFANSRAAFSNATIARGDTQESILAQLTAEMPSLGWITDPGDATKRYLIPMWGVMDVNVSASSPSTLSGIYMHRMLSRVDVNVTGDDAETGGFIMKDIKLYNVQQSGRIAPKMANWTKDAMVNGIPAGLATAPSLTSNGALAAPISFSTAIASGGKSCIQSIYIPEALKGKSHSDPDAPFLLVLGTFAGVDGWYRIDIANYTADPIVYMDVLRNHLYRVEIRQVTGTGFPTEEDAIRNHSTHMVVGVTQWNRYDLDGAIFNGSYFIAVSPQDTTLTEDAHTGKRIAIRTDLATGMEHVYVKVSGSPNNPDAGLVGNWVKLHTLINNPGTNLNRFTLPYDLDENPSDQRTAYLHIKVRTSTVVARITQEEGGAILSIPDYLMIGKDQQNPAEHIRLSVSCLKRNGENAPNGAWSLEVTNGGSWLGISTSSAPNSGAQTVSGTGSADISLFAPYNTGASVREATVTLKNAQGVTMGTTTIRQNGDNPAPTPVDDRTSCVGAFWRHDQIGERIVQVNVGASSGAWTAMVSFYDSKWNPLDGDGVLIAASGSDDTNVGTNVLLDAELFPLTGKGYTNSASGVAAANSNITFRIGIEKTFDAFHKENNPARYAVVELWYANHTKMQPIYLRHGEGDDYVMRPDAPDHRSAARKFSPYNLTAGALNAQVGLNGTGNNPGKFVAFPSQIGAFFQWGHSGLYVRYAWDTHTEDLRTPPVSMIGTEWNKNLPTSWSDSFETCPDGYRRPDDHSTISASEIRQSLWLDPPTGQTNNRSNYLYGYYADGFYDSLHVTRIGSSVGIVRYEQDDAAYGGGLFYNPVTKASLFFPVSAFRGMADGKLDTNMNGFASYYWTRTRRDEQSGYSLAQRNQGFLVVSETNLAQANSIRCIKKP